MLKANHRHLIAAFCLDGALSAGFTAHPFFVADQLGGGPRMSGTILAAQSLLYAAACFVSSRYAPKARNGLRYAYVGIAGFAVFWSISAFAREPWLYAAGTTVGKGFAALAWPALQSWIGGEPDPKKRSRGVGYFNIAWTAGVTSGPLLAGPLYDLDYRLPFLLVFVLGTVAWSMALSLPEERKHFAGQGQPPPPSLRDAHDRHGAASERHLRSAWVANLTAWTLEGALRAVFPLLIKELVESGELRLLFEARPAAFWSEDPATKASWLLGVISASRAGAFLLMGFTTWWHHRFWPIACLELAAAAAFGLLTTSSSLLMMAAALVFVGAFLGAAYYASIYYSLANPALKHQRAAIHETTVGAGTLAGSQAYGEAAQRMGLIFPFIWTPPLVLAALAFQAALLFKKPKRAK